MQTIDELKAEIDSLTAENKRLKESHDKQQKIICNTYFKGYEEKKQAIEETKIKTAEEIVKFLESEKANGNFKEATEFILTVLIKEIKNKYGIK